MMDISSRIIYTILCLIITQIYLLTYFVASKASCSQIKVTENRSAARVIAAGLWIDGPEWWPYSGSTLRACAARTCGLLASID